VINSNATLTNQDNSIRGFGYINSGFYFVNNALVDADVGGRYLYLSGTISGTGTYTASNGGILGINGTVTGGVFNGPSSGGQVTGVNGTLAGSANVGLIGVAADCYLRLAGTITNSGTILVGGANNITNSGTILLDQSNARLGVDNGLAHATLAGGGVVRLAADDARIGAINNSNATLTNQNNTIRGFGYINSNFNFVNNATVNADVAGRALYLYGPTSGTGTYTASGGGVLGIVGVVTGGVFDGPSSGGLVTAYGGTLIDSANVGVFGVADDCYLRLAGTITNSGTILLDQNNARMGVDAGFANATLAGGGVVRLAADSARITAINNNNGTLINQDNTICGYGYINSDFNFINHGTVNADVGGRTLSVYTSNFVNTGTLAATNGGLLNGPGGYTQTSGVTLVANSSTIITGNGPSFGNLQIAGGRLEGSGTVGANVTIADTISPGNAVGSLAIGGDLTLTDLANLQIELGGLAQGTQYDFLSEAGTVPLTLAGTLDINFTNNFQLAIQPTDVFTILSSNATLLGAFSNMVGGRIATADYYGTLALSLVDNSVLLSDFVRAGVTPPSITSHPASQTIVSGATVTLSVTAVGAAPLTYQWYRGPTGTTTAPVGTDSASFTTPAITATTSYWVKVTNAANPTGVKSNTATLTVPPQPVATTGAATAITVTAATLVGTVNPNGYATIARFDYGLTTAYGSTASVTLSPTDGSTAQNVSANITGLQAGQTYHYRLSATNDGGTTPGADMMFVTAVPFTYTTSNGKITITGYTGSADVVTIPATINGLPVTGIRDFAFYNRSDLTSVMIPGSVTSIGDFAFYSCSSLTNITLSDGLISIGDFAFFACGRLTRITLPASVTGIGNYAFALCTSLTRVTLGSGLTSLGDGAFYYCTALTNVTIPSRFTYLGESAFEYCTSLTRASFTGNAPLLGWGVF
ncbi:MAG: leucine-rich repeat protein, partial [Verrucomicrobia bacterium]|nr:leucine-rich repeat protein [Verrucomicrobiota bacterium]